MSHALILASQSKTRAQLLEGAGVPFTAVSSGLDEDGLKGALRAEGASVSRQAETLAEAKALRISLKMRGVVLGADQMMECAGEAFDKPSSIAEARDQLLRLRGREHVLHTALVACEDGVPVWRTLARPRLVMRRFSDAFLEGYLAEVGESCLASVGAYQLEGRGAQLFEAVEGDYFSILGLPLLPLLSWLRDRGALVA